MISDLVKENGVKITLNSIVGAFSAFFSIWLISLITDDALEQISTDLVSWTIKFFNRTCEFICCQFFC